MRSQVLKFVDSSKTLNLDLKSKYLEKDNSFFSSNNNLHYTLRVIM